LLDDSKVLDAIFKTWQSEKPILVHAEGENVEKCITLSKKYNRRLHICHISQKEEVEMVRKAKNKILKSLPVQLRIIYFLQLLTLKNWAILL